MGKDSLDPGDVARRLPDYRLLHELAHGGMGVVYLAEETALERRVAVKVLSPPQTEDEEFRRRFIRESRMAAALDHPNVIPIYRAEDADGLLYIVMRYVGGPDLDTLLRDEGPLDPDRAIAVLAQAAAALDAAHTAGLIHRDVKPANILLDRASGHVYLVDFGIAKRLSADSAITTVGDFVGTLPYASPEQIEGKPVDGRTDVYALGCVLYRCLTGTLPYPQNETAALMWAHLHQDPPRAADRRPGLPAAVDRVIATALAKDPEDRYATCADLIAALRAAAAEPPSDAQDAAPMPLPVVPPPPDPPIASPTEAVREFPLLGGPQRAAPTRRLLKKGAPLATALALLAVLVIALWPNSAGTGIGAALASGEITTVAGKTLLSGDGGPAIDAPLNNPGGIAVDAAGRVYIAEQGSHRIRRIDPDGTITTIAGTGAPGFSGDGGPAVNARLNGPTGVAVDTAGNLYIADRLNDRVRKLNSDGVITTIAGIDERSFFGDGGPAANAALNLPFGIAVDAAGSVYIAEEGNHRIRRIDPDGTIATIAGTGAPGFSGDGGPAANAALNTPTGIAVDAAGSLYIADWGNYRVRRVSRNGVITTIAGTVDPGFSGDGGPATNARLNGAAGVGVDAKGSLYIAEAGNHLVRKVNPDGVITTIAGSRQQGFSGDGPAVNSALDTPQAAAIDAAGNLYFTEWGNDRVRRLSPDGVITTIAGAPQRPDQGEAATEAALNDPTDLTVDAAGSLYIADSESHRVRRIDRSGTITTVAGSGEPGFSGDGGPAANARLSSPRGAAVDAAGNLYIADGGNHRIRKVNPNGVITTIAGTGRYGFSGDDGPAVNAALGSPRTIVADTAGNLYVADTGYNRVRRINPAGVITTIAGTGEAASSGDGGPAINAALNTPIGIAFDDAGNLYIAEEAGHRVRRIDPAGTITTIAGTGTYGFSGDGGPATDAKLNTPESLAFDADGNLYIAEFNNQRVRRIDRDRIISTVAGNGDRGLSGDGGPAVNAALDQPSGIALDPHGNLYISEWGNDRIRKVKLATDAAAGSG